MEAAFSDTWQVATGSVENGYTLNGSVRFDYLFRSYDNDWRMTPTSCWVQSTDLSDHWPVIADYNIQ
jgi:endonuclease/exonuclease/phosphatase (EEP) superfamily protein YafD